MEGIHDRMPVILHERDESTWLDAKVKNLSLYKNLLKPYNGQMGFYAVSKEVNSPSNDTPNVLKEIKLADK